MEISLRKDIVQKQQIAQLHYRIDLYAEIPILLGVLISGLLLFDIERLSSPIYLAKVVTGLSPIVINALCIIPVVKRKWASDRDDIDKMEQYTKLVFLAFATGFTMAMVALGLGMNMLGIF